MYEQHLLPAQLEVLLNNLVLDSLPDFLLLNHSDSRLQARPYAPNLSRFTRLKIRFRNRSASYSVYAFFKNLGEFLCPGPF